MTTAKIFWSGHSQAIRLPKAFRFPPETEEVAIRRQGVRVILEPIRPQEWPESFWQAFGDMPEDFERPAAAEFQAGTASRKRQDASSV